MNNTWIFHPMIWRYKNNFQVEIKIQSSQKLFKINARDQHIAQVKIELDAFSTWLRYCNVFKGHLEEEYGVAPRALKPQARDEEIEKRIARVTDSKRTIVDLLEASIGPNSTRVSRMEVVAWVCVCLFDCRIEGGFVRDWIVGGYKTEPNTPKIQWLVNQDNMPSLVEGLVPPDLDVHLSAKKEFDITKFKLKLEQFHIEVDKIERDGWRYLIVLDSKTETGPFMMDMIEPHVQMCHDMIDFDVSNLFVMKDWTKEFGMRVNINEDPNIEHLPLEEIVSNIKQKKFNTMRGVDSRMQLRIDKMIKRGWTQKEQFIFVPNKGKKFGAILAYIPKTDEQYKFLESKIMAISNARVLSIEKISNFNLEHIYSTMKDQIAFENKGNANEKLLFHGTDKTAAEGIQNFGFDDRWWSQSGRFGRGAYFADDVMKSNSYVGTSPDCIIFYCKVLLGNQNIFLKGKEDAKLNNPGKGFHSIKGDTGFNEYIVYRYGVALPLYKVTYSK